jgi:DNA-binding NarL/FixJ family response regulator
MSIKVAIVEDDRGFRGMLEAFINEAPGYRCVCACGSAEDALRAIPKTEPDVVLMDIQLPNRSGIECTAKLRQTLKHAPVIMLTGNADAESVFKALQAGAKGYLLKRTATQRLLPAIQEVLAGGAPMTGEVARKVVEFFEQSGPRPDANLNLTRREEEILDLISQGYSDKEIASRLNLAFQTVRSHITHVFEKLHVCSRTAAAARYLAVTERPVAGES